MSKTQFVEQGDKDVLRQSISRWCGVLTSTVPSGLPAHDCRLVAGEGRSRKLYLRHEIDSAPPLCAERAGRGVIFDGTLYNRRNLRAELGDFLAPPASNDAEIILAGYLRWGEELLGRLRGTFALLIWDSLREIFLCLRDPLGTYPMFYAEGRHELLVSPSIDVLIRQPHISGAVNRAALADYLVDRFPRLEETFFDDVSRVPPGHVMRVTREGRRMYRYWDPAPEGVVNWIGPEELERFDELLDRAVRRCLRFGPAGIFLSGGLDSVTVAGVAAQQCRAEGLPEPWALSLVFPHPEANEQTVQQSVAEQLGLSQVIKPFYEATGPDGLLAPAFAMSASLPAPLLNVWLPAYSALAREGKRRGCQVILTGGGGDEWLTISPFLAADLLRAFDLAGVYRLWRSIRRSSRGSSLALLRSLLWRFGARPLLLPPAHKFVKRVAPWALKVRTRMRRRPPSWMAPKWVAPGATLRRQFEERRQEEHANQQQANQQQASGSFYIRESRPALDHPLVSWEAEEIFNVYQAVGVRVAQPFWDADLVDLLYRTPPFLLNHGGRNKGLVRASLARRFPNLGFERQRKVVATNFYADVVNQQGRAAWKQLGSARALADLGVIDEQGLRANIEQLLARRQDPSDAYRVWVVLNLESWARTHIS